MYIFRSIYEIINTISTAKTLLTEMFEKRKTISFRYIDALELLKDDENRLKILIEKEVIHQNGNFLELDVRFLDFFETLLEANEEIDTATIDENIEYLHELMDYYLKEKIQSRKESYVRNIKLTFQKIARVTIRNIMNLQNSIDNTFKHEPTYQIKIAKLKNLDKKRINIQNLIDSTEHLILHEERLFFQQATDEELGRILLELRQELQLSAHSLIRAQQDIINYLNQIKNQVILVEKIRKVKYLQDQFELRARSNLAEVMENEHSVLLEGCTQTSFKLSPEYLASDEARPIILRILSNRKTREHIRKNEAGAFSEEDMKAQAMYEEVVNLEEVVKSFLQSGAEAQWKNEQPKDLFTFLLHYSFQREVNEEECTTLFCQIPDNTALIFEYMQKGQFICSNSTDIDLRDMYNMIDENYESLYQYFSQINYTLERGNEYFYFSRTESKTTLEQKILRAYYWIDVLDFFKTYDETFGAGFRFQPEQILVEANINVLLQNKLDGIRKHFSDKDIRKDVLDNMIRLLAKESFIELENEKTNTYKVLTSWHYLEKLVDSINIFEDIEDEKPE